MSKKMMVILLLACTNTAVYGVPYLKDMFYDLIRNALGITNTQIGIMCSCYGGIAVIGYIIGGIMADKISIRKLIAVSGMISGGLCFYLLTIPSFFMTCITFALMAIASVMTFYPAAMKAVSMIGGEAERGSMYGIFYLANSICGMTISAVNIWLVSVADNEKEAFITIVGLYGIVNCISSISVLGIMNTEKNEEHRNKGYPAIGELVKMLRRKEVWMLVMIVFTNYILNCMAAYYNTYLTNVLGYDSQFTYIFSIIRIYVITLFVSPVIGRITDKVKSSIQIVKVCFEISTVCLFIVVLFYDRPEIRYLIVFCILFCVVTVSAVHVIAFVPVSEIGIPVEKQGMIIGLMSFVGFSPDAYYYLIMGKIIDAGGNEGFQRIFIFSAICSAIGMIIARKTKERYKQYE